MDILTFIERSDILGGASDKSRKLLADICIPKRLEKKQILFREGETGYAFYLLVSGGIALSKGTSDGREVVIKIVRPGEIFAEVILFEQDKYPVTAVVVNAGLVLVISKHQFNCLLSIEEFRNDFISMLMRKQRYLAEKIRHLTMHDVEERFYLFIKEHYGIRNSFNITFSKKDIAAAIGATPETYSRLINRLCTEKKLRVDGKTIFLSESIIKELKDSEKGSSGF